MMNDIDAADCMSRLLSALFVAAAYDVGRIADDVDWFICREGWNIRINSINIGINDYSHSQTWRPFAVMMHLKLSIQSMN